jgi:hypothetical protein
MVGPELNGWTAVFPENYGQDFSACESLSRSTDALAFHVLVHDDDFLAYELRRDGELQDEYNSLPDYFEDVSRIKGSGCGEMQCSLRKRLARSRTLRRSPNSSQRDTRNSTLR